MNAVTLTFPLESALNTTARLTTGGVCAFADLSFDDSEDCKVCVTESLLLLAGRGFTRASITFIKDRGLKVIVGGEEKKAAETKAEDGISAALIAALAENVVMEKKDGEIYKIGFEFGLKA